MNAIDCGTARERMLEADIAELKAETDSPLSQHIRGCATCAAAAAHLLRSYDRLELGLRTLARPKKQSWRRWVAAPLAAAAIIALLLGRASEPAPVVNEQLLALMFRDEPVVTPPAGKQAIVVEHGNLTVAWFYSSGDTQ